MRSVAHFCPQVPAMHVDQLAAEDMSQPQEEGKRRIAEILGQLPGRLEVRLLQNVRAVDAPLQAAIEPEPHRPPQAIVVACEQIVAGGLIAVSRLPQQSRALIWFVRHKTSHCTVCADRARFSSQYLMEIVK